MAGSLQLQQFGLRGSESAGAMLSQAGQRNLDRQEHGLDRLSREMMQLRALDAHEDQQQKQIDARMAMEKQSAEYAYKMTAIKAGLQDRLAEREFDNRLQEIQAKAKADAMQFDYEFTAEQRMSLAKYQTVLQAVEQSDAYSPEEKQIIRIRILADMAGVQPTAIPAKGPKLPDWADPFGVSIEPKSGMAGTFEERNGKLNFKPLPKEMQQSYQQYAAAEKKMEFDSKAQEKMMEFLMEPVETDTGKRFPTRDEIANRYISFKDARLFAESAVREPKGERQVAGEPQRKSRGARRQLPPPRSFGKMNDAEQAVIADEPIKVTDKQQYDKLPSGTPFIAPDGSFWVKK